ncbi:MAG: protein translocase SEC61 complex subunit gamma [Candidatus Thermoplasmatota archaeon]|jgi:protein transport protein SEC61 subunit gamma-like protein|nr:protein translocase SEC61 complex subunit gamma [Candidatus Thermoplasmatota archaeon]MCL5799737.1 protein translocase SEC61 complex subunit gamma [Candidatus Thermoplasmatota archaeon]
MAIEDSLLDVQKKVERRFSNIGKGKYARILKMARKPTSQEYVKILFITGMGIIFLGVLGFVIYLITLYTGLQ